MSDTRAGMFFGDDVIAKYSTTAAQRRVNHPEPGCMPLDILKNSGHQAMFCEYRIIT